MKKTLLLFDIDGTLTLPRHKITNDMKELLKNMKQKYDIGFVGGSDRKTQIYQLGDDLIKYFTWQFSENGLDTYYNNKKYHTRSIIEEIGEEKYKKLINIILRVLSVTDVPIKRGTFIELRNGLINVSPIGRNCSKTERDNFELFDKKYKIRDNVIKQIKNIINCDELNFSIGGQISFDIMPNGWDKTYCLQFLYEYDYIYFFGDMVEKGGNDYELYYSNKVIGIKVNNYKETITILRLYF